MTRYLSRPPRNSPPYELPLRTLLYRYFFFSGWLFRDASSGTFMERAAALQFNRERCGYLPIYLRRWMVMLVVSYGLGTLLEATFAPGVAAALCYGLTTVSMAVSASIARCWLLLRYG